VASRSRQPAASNWMSQFGRSAATMAAENCTRCLRFTLDGTRPTLPFSLRICGFSRRIARWEFESS
jgi:hypothetical protein